MKKKMLITTLIIAGILITGRIQSVRGHTVISTKMVSASHDALLARYDKGNRLYKRLEIEEVKIVSYFHRREIGQATVEKDFIRYQFDTETEELIEETKKWRSDLPAQLPPVIPQAEAESIVEGVVDLARLYIISPESLVFPIDPTPNNPCWVVWSTAGKRKIISIIDATTGKMLGYGVPPPYEGFSFYGPNYGPCPQDPFWGYQPYAESARIWFENMGYNTEKIGNASRAKVQSHIQSDSTAMFYEMNHGGYDGFYNQCDSWVNAADVETWIDSYANMPFTFLASCDGMCDTNDNTFSHEFRKGSNEGTVTVGYCHMEFAPCVTDCWQDAYDWQTTLFDWMNSGSTVGYAFIRANLAYPYCAYTNNCMRIAGDTDLKVVPVVARSLCGNVYDGSKGPLTMNRKDHYISCDISVPTGQTLTIDPGVDLLFFSDSKVTSYGTLNANGAAGQIRFVSEPDISKGMELTGQIRMRNGGQIRIYE